MVSEDYGLDSGGAGGGQLSEGFVGIVKREEGGGSGRKRAKARCIKLGGNAGGGSGKEKGLRKGTGKDSTTAIKDSNLS